MFQAQASNDLTCAMDAASDGFRDQAGERARARASTNGMACACVEKVKKVREGWRKLEKVGEGSRKLEKVGES